MIETEALNRGKGESLDLSLTHYLVIILCMVDVHIDEYILLKSGNMYVCLRIFYEVTVCMY